MGELILPAIECAWV